MQPDPAPIDVSVNYGPNPVFIDDNRSYFSLTSVGEGLCMIYVIAQ